ncbi:hypothetical protein GCM10028822_03640 [Hymenobacter terrigena]
MEHAVELPASLNPPPARPVLLECYTDPLCPQSRAFEPHWQRLRAEFGHRFAWRYRLGGPSVASYPACLAVKCAERQGAQAGERYLHAVADAAGRPGRNVARPEVLAAVADELAPGRLLYRGIPGEELPARVADVSYPPPEAVRHDERANRAGAPMFYCSATWHPPFFEARVRPGDGIVISCWQPRQPLRILSFGYADTCADDPHSDREKALHQALAQLPAETRALATFLTSTFTRTVADDNQHHYRLSIAVA